MNIENLSTLKIHKLTEEQYNREKDSESYDPTAIYLTPDEDIPTKTSDLTNDSGFITDKEIAWKSM